MEIENGWVFYSADFSMQADGTQATGSVMLVRNIEDKRRWHEMNEEVINGNECPPLYVRGAGVSVEDAIDDANLSASHARPIMGSGNGLTNPDRGE